MTPCRKCEAKCCRYFALEIDTPRSKDDFENIRWFLAHKGVAIYVEKRKWHLEIANSCRFLTEDHRCRIYDNRPLVCREYDPSTCDNITERYDHELEFRNLKEFDEYLGKRFTRKSRKKSGKRKKGK